jgi:hypothetical protein
MAYQPTLVVFSGGTAFNNVAGEVQATVPSSEKLTEHVMSPWSPPSTVIWPHNNDAGQLRQLSTRVVHVLPVSDDGGSTAEIVRVLGGPAVGDIRSRCLRLADDTNHEVEPLFLVKQFTPKPTQFHAWSMNELEEPIWHGI